MRLFSTDIDGTVYQDFESASQFAGFWKRLRGKEDRPLLVYNTGRSLDDARNLLAATGLPRADFLICGVGTQIYSESESRLLDGWFEELDAGWDFDTVFDVVRGQSPARPQPEECQNDFKCSWFWEDAGRDAIRRVTDAIAERGVRAQAVYSSNRDLDFLPEKANKGNALAWLSKQLGIPTEEVVVAGDSGNDASMYQVAGVRGVLVANAEEALVEAVAGRNAYRASRPCAAGVIEGLERLLNGSPGAPPQNTEKS